MMMSRMVSSGQPMLRRLAMYLRKSADSTSRQLKGWPGALAPGAVTARRIVERRAVTAPGASAPGQPFNWREVESADFRKYIANLRSIGCPEETIRDIIITDVNKLYAAKLASVAGRA